MQNKYKLPDDLRDYAISLVKGYKRRCGVYHSKRSDIILSAAASTDGQPRGTSLGDTTLSKTIQLEKLEMETDTLCMRAVEQATVCIGTDIADERERQRLRAAIHTSCIEGRRYIFRYSNMLVSKSNFYYRRSKFLYQIVKILNLY